MRTLIALLLVTALSGCSVSPSNPGTASGTSAVVGSSGYASPSVDFENTSDSCAWMTVYWSYKIDPNWHIADDPGNRPRFVGNGSFDRYWNFWIGFSSAEFGAQLRMRAEVKRNSNCSGETISDMTSSVDIPEFGLTVLHSILSGSKGNYSLTLVPDKGRTF